MEILTDKDKILQYLKHKGISKNRFYTETGLSIGFLDSGNSLGVDKLRIIIDKYHDLNPDWFIREGAQMIISNEEPSKLIKNTENGIPLVSINAAAGFGNSHFSINKRDVVDYYIIPKFKTLNPDFLIEVHGSSMERELYGGDIVACKILKESRFIQWNKCHVIATTEQGLIIKRLRKSDVPDTILAISDNIDYDPFLIPTNEITGIALVIGVIRIK